METLPQKFARSDYNGPAASPETGVSGMAPLPKGQDLEVKGKSMKKILALAMVLGVLGSIVAGCGEKKADDAAAPATTAATTGTASSDTTKTP